MDPFFGPTSNNFQDAKKTNVQYSAYSVASFDTYINFNLQKTFFLKIVQIDKTHPFPVDNIEILKKM